MRSTKKSESAKPTARLLLKQGYKSSEFATEAASDAFCEGLSSAVDEYRNEFDYVVIEKGLRKNKKWVVYFKIEELDIECDCGAGNGLYQ